MESFRIDRASWPLVVIHYYAEMRDADLDDYIRQMLELLAMPARQAHVYDATHAHRISPEMRRKQGELLKRHRDVMREKIAGAAFVFPSAMHRFILSTVFLVAPYPAPYAVCATLEEGITWASRRLPRVAGA